MSCVNWWNNCTKCGNESYDRERKHICEKCGGVNQSIREWDEEPDEPIRPRFYKDQYGDIYPDEE